MRIVSFFCALLGFSSLHFLNAQVISTSLSYTFTNPVPLSQNVQFGQVVKALNESQVVIGSPLLSSGTAYLYATNGSLINAISSPVAGSPTDFAASIAVVGPDRLLIGARRNDTGASDAGIAYLYATNGTLLTTFTNPTPRAQEYFGRAVCVLDSSRVIISADGDGNFFSPGIGAVYIHSTNGLLLNTITNPNPAAFFDSFGRSVSVVGEDKILVGSPGTRFAGIDSAGIAYLLSTNGTVLTTFTNPTPALGDSFGLGVATLGNDRVLIAASDSGASGAVYLFSTNGTLLRSFVSPDPAGNEGFGSALAVSDTGLIFIGAFQDTPAPMGMFQTGTVYIFNTNGTLLRTISNPSPAANDHFGVSIALVGTNKVLIGADQKSMDGLMKGAAYLFNLTFLPPPALSVESLGGGTVRITWPFPSTGFVIDSCGALNSPPATNGWTEIPPPYGVHSYTSSNGVPVVVRAVTVTASTNQFFRLRQP